jgi:diaminohydroxyphosphoribosylaminopyrimidine deaminase / 5-amino-6-(5-phosphoribosylamino)uracil reductase
VRSGSRDDDFTAEIDRAVVLARQGLCLVEPNPAVGAVVLAADGRRFEGWHSRFGGPHAEIVALAAAGGAARGSTVVVTLEPCSTHGKTPPCTEALVAAGVARVVFASIDPYGPHSGSGPRWLADHGVVVDGPIVHAGAEALLDRFREHVSRRRAFVTAKWAMTLDGKIATRAGDSKWISGEDSRLVAHELRGSVDGIAVGVGTVIADSPRLTARPAGPRTPLRIVFDRSLRTPSAWPAWHDGGPGIVLVHGAGATSAQRSRCVALGAELVEVDATDSDAFVARAVEALRARGIESLLVEGGATLLGAFADAGCIDRVVAFVAPLVIGGRDAIPAVGGLGVQRIADALAFDESRFDAVGDDVVFRGLTRRER